MSRPSDKRTRIIDPLPALGSGLVSLVVLTLIFRSTNWDLDLSTYYWNLGKASWTDQAYPLLHWAYRFGTYPALLTGILGGLAFALSYRLPSLRPWRGAGLFAFLLLILGPGLLVNGLGKALMGRPRPSDVLGLGGPWNFAKVGDFGPPGRGQSFPSGHASMAFYWLGLFFLWHESKKWRGLMIGLGFGAIMSWARIVEGGHFLSDTLFSGAIVFTLAAALSPLIYWQPRPAFWSKREVLGALGLGVFAYLSIAQIVYEERSFIWTRDTNLKPTLPTQRISVWPNPEPVNKIALDLQLQQGDINMAFTGQDQGPQLPLRLDEFFSGQGFPGAKDNMSIRPLETNPLFVQGPGTLGAHIVQTLKGAWWTLHARYELQLPLMQSVDVRLKTERGTLTIGSLPRGRQVVLFGKFHQEDLPPGFLPHDQTAWLRDGAQPQIALTLDAPTIHFQP